MNGIIEILRKSVVLAVVVTIAVVVLIAYQLVTKQAVESPALELLVALLTYWIGVLTPAPIKINGE